MTDDAFASMHDNLFEAFGQDAIVERAPDDPVPVRVIVDRGVKRLGEYGQAIASVDMVSFRQSVWDPKSGDLVTLETAAGSRTRKVDRIEAEDGFVVKVSLHG